MLGRAMDQSVKFPYIRASLIEVLRTLSDRGHQRRVWVDHVLPHPNYYDEFDVSVHLLFDDTSLAEKPQEWIGFVLKNEHEVELVGKVGQAIERLFAALGTRKTDKEYIESPLWDDVVEAAKRAHAAIDSPEDRFPD